jgi:hypothetical protein
MTYQAFFPTGGAEGFDYLRRTRALQTKQLSERDTAVQLEVISFRSAIRNADTARELLENPRLRDFVLKAFDLTDRAGETDFLRRALNESTDQPRALAVNHDDLRVRELAETLRYWSADGPANRDADVIAAIEKRYLDRAFEENVAKQDKKLAEALAFDRKLADAAALDGAEALKWERLLDDPGAARALNRSLELPDGFAQLPERDRIAALDAAYGRQFFGNAQNLTDAQDRRALVRELLNYDPAKAFADEPGGTIGFYQPILPFEGLAGWSFLNRTLEKQQAMFNRTAEVRRDVEYFMQNIGKADTAEKLVNDRRLLKVALGAFGMGDEIDKRALLQKMFEGGVEDPRSVANKLVDRRFKEITAAFGYGDAKGAQVDADGFAQAVAERYRERAFEVAVGAVNPDMRLAMNFEREIVKIAGGSGSANSKLFSLLGDKALRDVFEPALGLPKEFGKLDIELQAEEIDRRFRNRLGDGGLAELLKPEARETLLRDFFIRRSAEAGPAAGAPGSAALVLLQNAAAPAGAGLNLLA